jgi:hypothetical protein
MRRANPDSQAYPEAVRQNFASLVKVFFGIIQCLHHSHTLDGQRQGRNSAKAFQAKVKELNSFVRPARSGPWVQAEISKINENWAMQVSQTLAQHYRQVLEELKKTAKGLVAGLDWSRAQQIAESWAHRNYRKKLNQNTLKSFRDIIRELAPSESNANSPTPSPHLRDGPQGSGSGKASGNPLPPSRPNSQPRPPRSSPSRSSPSRSSSPPSGPSVPLSNRFSPLAPITPSDPSPGTSASSSSDPPTYASTVASSPKGMRPKVTSPKRSDSSGQRYRAENTKSKNSVWRLPAVSDKLETLVVGTSNIDNIKMPINSTTALWSYPGAKFDNFVVLFERALQEGVFDHVKNVILSCGINDRDNKADVTTFPRYKRACTAMRELFPSAAVYFVLPNWSEGLSRSAQRNMSQFSTMASKENKGLVHLIPSLPTSEFQTVQDNVHWTEVTANRMLVHWLDYTNKPINNGTKNNHKNSKN